MGAQRLVEQAKLTGVTDARVLEAVRTVPRAAFVPPEHVPAAEVDEPTPIPHAQVTTQPSLSARMIAALRLAGKEHVLEVGTGLGYQTALLAFLARFVTSVERWPDLAAQARQNLTAQHIENVLVIVGDGTEGAPDYAPYDAVIVSAAFPEVPQPLADQLRPGGLLVQPIGPGGAERVTLFERAATGLVRREEVIAARFVRLIGRHAFP